MICESILKIEYDCKTSYSEKKTLQSYSPWKLTIRFKVIVNWLATFSVQFLITFYWDTLCNPLMIKKTIFDKNPQKFIMGSFFEKIPRWPPMIKRQKASFAYFFICQRSKRSVKHILKHHAKFAGKILVKRELSHYYISYLPLFLCV